MAVRAVIVFKMDPSRRLLVFVFHVLMMTSSLTCGERYTRVIGVKYVVPGSWTGDCGNQVMCTALFCATQCTWSANCRSFSYSPVHRQCVFSPWYFNQTSSQAVLDTSWSTYGQHSRECDVQPCQNGGTCSDVSSGGVTCACDVGYTGNLCEKVPKHCQDLINQGQTTSGVYIVYPDDVTPVSVYCDQEREGGGWVVFQRRQDGGQNFDLSLQDYKDGFGDFTAEFWLGLDTIRMFTSRRPHTLRVEMGSSRSTAVYAAYSNFDVDTSYALTYDAFIGGAAGDCLQHQKAYPFTTPPPQDGSFCDPLYYGGWWFANTCQYCNLNGRYGDVRGEGSSGTPTWDPLTLTPGRR